MGHTIKIASFYHIHDKVLRRYDLDADAHIETTNSATGATHYSSKKTPT